MAARAGVSKQDLRQQVWDYMEAHNLADFPRPVHGRIPNFKGSHQAAQHLQDLDIFAKAQVVKVDPDKPLEGARLLVLQKEKTLLVPTPRLRTGLLNHVTPPSGASKAVLRTCATSQGVRSYSTPVGLDSRVQVDLVVVGSVAVSEKGWRVGKGEGYTDLEFAMMAAMGAVSQETPVLTIVHDCQVLDFPEALLGPHDLTVDFILTPTRLLTTHCARPRPVAVFWAQISKDMLARIPVLRSLRTREQQAGKDVTLQSKPLQSAGRHSDTSGARWDGTCHIGLHEGAGTSPPEVEHDHLWAYPVGSAPQGLPALPTPCHQRPEGWLPAERTPRYQHPQGGPGLADSCTRAKHPLLGPAGSDT